MAAGILKTAEMAAKGAAAFIGKPLGIDTEKQTWTWENFKDAWVNHPVESFAAVFPFGASFLKRKGITPSETQVRELVDSAVRDEKTPLAQELKKEMEEGPPQEELDFIENSRDAPKSGATFGQATTNDYRSTFFAGIPNLKGRSMFIMLSNRRFNKVPRRGNRGGNSFTRKSSRHPERN